MAEVFGNKGPKNVGGGGQGDTGVTTKGGDSHYIEIDNDSGEMAITLPPEFAEHKAELQDALMQEFFLANPDDNTVGAISDFIEDWLARKTGDQGRGRRR